MMARLGIQQNGLTVIHMSNAGAQETLCGVDAKAVANLVRSASFDAPVNCENCKALLEECEKFKGQVNKRKPT